MTSVNWGALVLPIFLTGCFMPPLPLEGESKNGDTVDVAVNNNNDSTVSVSVRVGDGEKMTDANVGLRDLDEAYDRGYAAGYDDAAFCNSKDRRECRDDETER